MTIQNNLSEVARLRQQIDLEYESAQLGLYGPAEVAKHAFITARMERAAERIARLLRAGKQAEAAALLNSERLYEDDEEASNGEAAAR